MNLFERTRFRHYARICRQLTLLAALAGFGHSAMALDCKQPQTQADMNACAAQDLNNADSELNDTYVALRAQLSPARQTQIREVQLAWLKYRDLSCRFESAGAAGGSAASMALQGCLTDKTRQRTRELKSMTTCQEGDISCVR